MVNRWKDRQWVDGFYTATARTDLWMDRGWMDGWMDDSMIGGQIDSG